MRGFAHESAYNESKEWYTPPYIFQALGTTFDLDPCAPADRVLEWIPAAKRLTVIDNGLLAPWQGFVWMNPPYGQDTPAWMKRLAEHGEGIALVFARTDTGWFQGTVNRASIVCFVRKRIRFIRADGFQGNSPGAGSCLIGFGEKAREVIIKSGLGLCMQEAHDVCM